MKLSNGNEKLSKKGLQDSKNLEKGLEMSEKQSFSEHTPKSKILDEPKVFQKTYFVVTGIVKHKGKFLILHRGKNDYNYPNKWSFCSGFVKEFEAAEETIIREIKEETGLKARIIKTGKVIDVKDKRRDIRWVIAVYLCEAKNTGVRLCKENQGYRWVKSSEFKKYPFVPGLSKDLKTLGLI